MDEQEEAYRSFLKELRLFSRISVREIEYYSGVSSSTFYGIEKGGDLRMTTFLRLLTLYLGACGYVFRHQALTDSLEEALRRGGSIRLVMEQDDPSGKVVPLQVLLEKLPLGKR